MPLFIPKPQLDQVTEQGQEAEARKKKAFCVSIFFILFLSLFVHRMIAKHTREGKKALACLHFFRQAMDKNTQWALFAAVYGFRVLTFRQMINS